MISIDSQSLNPKQQEVLKRLIDFGGDRPEYPQDFAVKMLANLETRLGPALKTRDPSKTWWLTKSALIDVGMCEGLHLARRAERSSGTQTWTFEKARGTLAHRCVEYLVLAPDTIPPLTAAEASLARLSETDSSLGEWIKTLAEPERVELVQYCTNMASEFLQQWPPINAEWQPRVEIPARAYLLENRVGLIGRYDLALGSPKGRQARTLIVDFKFGEVRPAHLDELRFYALVETLKLGIPPYRVAAYGFDSARFVVEDVTEMSLVATMDWLVQRALVLAEIESETRPPILTGNPLCTWCPALPNCQTGQTWTDSLSS